VSVSQPDLGFAESIFAGPLDASDQATARHSGAVAVYARDIGALLGLSATEQRVRLLSSASPQDRILTRRAE